MAGDYSEADRPDNSLALTLAAGDPEDVTVLAVGVAGQDEHQVAEPVQILRGEDVHRVAMHLDRRPCRPLGAADDGPGDVQLRRSRCAARKDERPQFVQRLVEVVAPAFEPDDVVGLDPQLRVLGVLDDGAREIGADIEQVVLDVDEHRDDVVGQPARRQSHSDLAVGLVDVGVRDQAQVDFGRLAQVAEARRAVVAGTRVNPGQVDHERKRSTGSKSGRIRERYACRYARQALGDAYLRRSQLRGRVQRAVPAQPREGPDRPLGGLRPPDADRLRPRPRALPR